MNISAHVSYLEATHSDMAKRLSIDNIPNVEQLENIKILAEKVFEPIREHFNVPIYISSFFRSKELNKKLKGAKNSQHMLGEAMDIDADMYGKITNKQIFDYIRLNLNFDQLIAEGLIEGSTNPSWIHCSYSENKNRSEILLMEKVGNNSIYYKYDKQKGLDLCSYR